MSLVERALEKLQQTQPRRPVAPPVPTPVPVTLTEQVDALPRAAAGSAAPKPRVEPPSRIVRIDRESLRAIRMLPPASIERRVASQYRQVKRPLIANALGKNGGPLTNGHVIMLTSALPGEGKTFTSVNLALSMALEQDIEVLLVDADVAKPHVTRLFDLSGERGLLDLLTDGELHPDSVILRTDVPGLSILPAGKQIATATELLASERMQEVIAQLAAPDSGRIVLLDSPPLLLSTESVALLDCVGQIAMIVRAEVTPRKAVLDALDIMGEDRLVSLILNQCSAAPSAGYYGYGSYGAQPDEQAAAPAD